MRSNPSQIALIGYSGHAFVVFDIFFSQGITVSAYCEKEEKKENPFMLAYLGDEAKEATIEKLKQYGYFVCLGDNATRRKITDYLLPLVGEPENALHKTAILSRSINCGTGVMFGPRCVVNAKTEIGNGVILNTGS
ncbi:MAG: N-acetylneuraminate synthase, partial [Flavobacteriales bacterium]